MNTPHVVPPRERQFPGRAPAQERSAGCPTERKLSPQGARKNNGLGNDKGAIARMVLEALACLDLDPGVLNRIQLQLGPPPLVLNPPRGLQIRRLKSTRPSMTPLVCRLSLSRSKLSFDRRRNELIASPRS